MKSEKFKKLAVQVMIGGVIGAAAVAVVAVLLGEFNDALGKALFTILLVTVHALLSLAYLDNNENKPTGPTLPIFSNTVFGILVLSFFTSVLGVWGIIDGEIVYKLYLTYFVLVFAALHGELLFNTIGKTRLINNLVYSNYVFMALVVALLLPIIWVDTESFGDFYFRLLAAAGIIDATLTILVVIQHKLYLQKHPAQNSALFAYTQAYDQNGNPIKVKPEERRRHLHPLLWILIIYLGLQFILGMVAAISGGF